MLYSFRNKEEVVVMATAEEVKTKEQHMADYIASMKALEDAMEPFKEQKRELKAEFKEQGWLSGDEISLAVKAYRMLKGDQDIDELVEMFNFLRGDK